jgi:large subunit ribosomal protein L19e
MNLKTQKKQAAKVLKASKNRVFFDPERLEDIKEAITKTDIRGLISEGAIKKYQKKGTSHVRIVKHNSQRRKGLRKGPSTRKGKKTINKKKVWMQKVRTLRAFLRELRESKLIKKETYTDLYLKVKGNYFRSKRHIKIYLEDNKLIKK